MRAPGVSRFLTGIVLVLVNGLWSGDLRAVNNSDHYQAGMGAGGIAADLAANVFENSFLLAHRSPKKHSHGSELRPDSAAPALLTDSQYWRSPTTAFNYSLFGTILPTATIVASPLGLIAGPSLGYFYGGLPRRALLGMGIRLVGCGGAAAAFGFGWNASDDSEESAAVLAFTASTAIVLVSTVYDIARVKHHVRQRDAALSPGAVSLAPRFYGASRTPGLEIVLRF